MRFLYLATIGLLFTATGIAMAQTQDSFTLLEQRTSHEIEEINQKILEKSKSIEELKWQSELYRKNLEIKQSEILNLANQIGLLDNSIAKINIDIKTKEEEINEINLSIVKTQLEIQEKEKKISEQKDKIGEILRKIHQRDQRSYLEVLLLNESFSEFFDQIKYIQEVQSEVQNALDEVIQWKTGLESQNQELEKKNKQLLILKDKLVEYRETLDRERGLKEEILDQTQNSEQRFRNLLSQVRLEKKSIDTEIQELEDSIRRKVRQKQETFDLEGPSDLIWPITFHGIVTTFHDPDYVFRKWVGEHSGIDLRTLVNDQPANGLPIRAAATGTVVKVIQNGRYTGNAVYIAHSGGLMTVYLHLSKVDVVEDEFVPVGKVIAYGGGLPGTYGAGLSTGPHLHFEVRLNGIPVNPLDYLPPPVILASNE